MEDAEVAGTIDGTLTARGSLIVRATGRVLGTARCRRLQVEDGGQITGRIEMITEAAKPPVPEVTRPPAILRRQGQGRFPWTPLSKAKVSLTRRPTPSLQPFLGPPRQRDLTFG